MQNKLLLEINNLGPINKADLDIGKINVIVGRNSTGKSTSSKFLFCLLTSVSEEGIFLANADIKTRLENLVSLLKFNIFDENSYSRDDLNHIEELLNNSSSNELFEEVCYKLYELSKGFKSLKWKENYLKRLKRIHELIKINKNRDSRYVKTLFSLLISEYADSLESFTGAYVDFKGIVDNHSISHKIYLDGDYGQGNMDDEFYDYLNYENIVYIDSFSILELKDNERFSRISEEKNQFMDDEIPYHIQLLNRKIKNTNKKGIYDKEYYKELDDFKNKIDDMIGGDFKYDKERNRFILETNSGSYSMQNTSSGLKQLGIIQLLLKNRELTENSFLILDEPEVNLHPEFQIKLAQILVLAAKDLNITVYMNTHSPLLAEAIEVYSKYYKFYNQTNFYLTHQNEMSGKFDYELVDEMDIMEIYDNLGNPFDTLEEIRFKTELRDDFED